MAWFNFVICACFGIFGAHKFLEGKVALGFVYMFTCGLFGIGWLYDCYKYFKIASSGAEVNSSILSESTPLPVAESSSVPMTADEVCHYNAPAIFLKTKNVVVGYSGGSRGASIRVVKGVSFRVGASKSAPVRGNVQEKTPGTLTITNKRVIFSADKGAFDKKLASISSITPYKDAVAFQFGDKHYTLLCDKPLYVYQLVARIINTN